MWLAFFIGLASVMYTVKGECSYSSNGTLLATYGDTFEAYYYCCNQDDRECTECCSFSLLWPTLAFAFVIALVVTLVSAYLYFRNRKQLKEDEEQVSLLQSTE